MKINKIYIKNYKAFESKSFDLSQLTLIIGENDSGKSTILEALDIFFNFDKIEKALIRDSQIDVEIGVLIENDESLNFIKKIYDGKTGKITDVVGQSHFLDDVSYIYLSSNSIDLKKLISDLIISKFKTNLSDDIIKQLNDIAKSCSDDVLSAINDDILIFEKVTTSLNASSSFKFDTILKNDIKSNGVPIEGRGSGFKKNIAYALLTNKQYEKTIIGIDEIENSFSLNNVKNFIKAISNKFMQIMITTHSPSVMSCVDSQDVLPILDKTSWSVAELLSNLDSSKKKKFVLVEGKTDMKWIKAALCLLNVESEYIVIQCGGHTNIEPVKDELIKKNFKVFVIKDGDSKDSSFSLKKECIELYITKDYYNKLFNLNEACVPDTKNQFFSKPDSNIYNEDTIKSTIANHVSEFLTVDNELIEEIKNLLKINSQI